MQSIIYESFSNAFELLLASIVVIYSYTWPTIFIKKYNEDKNEDLPFKLVILYSFFGIIGAVIISTIIYFLRIRGSENDRADLVYSSTAFFLLLIPYLYGVLRWSYFNKQKPK